MGAPATRDGAPARWRRFKRSCRGFLPLPSSVLCAGPVVQMLMWKNNYFTQFWLPSSGFHRIPLGPRDSSNLGARD